MRAAAAYTGVLARLDRDPELLLHEVSEGRVFCLDKLMPVRIHLRVARLLPWVREKQCLSARLAHGVCLVAGNAP